jgi:hypothetical protein
MSRAMTPPGSRLRTSAQMIAGALVAQLVVYLDVLLVGLFQRWRAAPADQLLRA